MTHGLISIEDLQDAFFEKQGCPYWTLYYGHNAETKNKAASNKEISDMGESWELLYSNVNRLGRNGGKFLVFQTDKINTTNGFKTKISLPGPNASNQYNPQAQVAGIGGLPMSNQAIEARIDEAVSNAIESYDKELTIARLEAENKELRKGDGLIGALNNLLENPTAQPLLQTAISRFLGTPPQPATVGVQGYPSAATAPEMAQGENFYYDSDRIIEYLDRIRARVDDPHTVLEVLAYFFEQNEAIAIPFYQQQKEAYFNQNLAQA